MTVHVEDTDRFLFDLQGYLLLRSALTHADCDELIHRIHRLEGQDYDDSWMAASRAAASPMPTKAQEGPARIRMNGLLRLDSGFDGLIDHARILPYLEDFMDRPQIINTWSITKGASASSTSWHRGLEPTDYSVRQGRIRSRMLNVVWFLSDNGPQDGCMVAVPGSHKNNIDLNWGAFDADSMPGGIRLVGRKGDVLLMSESLLHDGAPKTTPGLRTNLYFNYAGAGFGVMTYSPEHNRHFCMPASVRNRFTAKQRDMSAWMEWATPIECPESRQEGSRSTVQVGSYG